MMTYDQYLELKEKQETGTNECNCGKQKSINSFYCSHCKKQYSLLTDYIQNVENKFPETKYIITCSLDDENFDIRPFFAECDNFELDSDFMFTLLFHFWNFIEEMETSNNVKYVIVDNDTLFEKLGINY